MPSGRLPLLLPLVLLLLALEPAASPLTLLPLAPTPSVACQATDLAASLAQLGGSLSDVSATLGDVQGALQDVVNLKVPIVGTPVGQSEMLCEWERYSSCCAVWRRRRAGERN